MDGAIYIEEATHLKVLTNEYNLDVVEEWIYEIFIRRGSISLIEEAYVIDENGKENYAVPLLCECEYLRKVI